MERHKLLATILLAESALGLLAIVWIRLRGSSWSAGAWAPGTAAGLGGAVVLAATNYYLLRHAPPFPPLRSLRAFYRGVLRPLFSRIEPLDLIAISIAAGVGEELFFRGALQSAWGLVPASLAFGAMHVAGRRMLVFGAWAALVGGVLGWLAIATNGLLAPIVAHSAYDALALAYIRWAPDAHGNDLPVPSTNESQS